MRSIRKPLSGKQALFYIPRHGSKAALAMDALRRGPMTTRQLSNVMQCAQVSVGKLLSRALKDMAIIRTRSELGHLYFSLPGMPSDTYRPDVSQGQKTRLSSGQNVNTDAGKRFPSSAHKSLVLISSNVHALTDRRCRTASATSDQSSVIAPAPMIAGLFSDGELTIAVAGECVRLDTAQRRQLYAYLHKIRDLT